jgi:hypothetical protein
MDENQLYRTLGEFGQKLQDIREDINDIRFKMNESEKYTKEWRKQIEDQLSIGKFFLMAAKTVGLVFVFVITFKFGDAWAVIKALFTNA